MSLKASVAYSTEEDAFASGKIACQNALEHLSGKPNLIILFASSKFDQQKVLEGVRAVSGETLLVGSSTAGEITTEGPVARNSVALMAISCPEILYAAAVGEGVSNNASHAARSAAEGVRSHLGNDMKSFIMFSDVLSGGGSQIMSGVLGVLGTHFPVVGGASGDDFRFEKTFQYFNGTVYSDSVVGLGLSGKFRIGIGVKHGWIPIGLSMKATKASGSTLFELNNEPAIRVYEDFFGATEVEAMRTQTLAKLSVTYPLGITVSNSDELLIRDPLRVNKDGSLTCAADIPQGSEVRLMIGSRESAIAMAEKAAEDALEGLDGARPKAILLFNCIARNKLFGERAGDEIDAIQKVLGSEVPLLGFYTYGEQAPLRGVARNIEQCQSTFHNETVVICALGDFG